MDLRNFVGSYGLKLPKIHCSSKNFHNILNKMLASNACMLANFSMSVTTPTTYFPLKRAMPPKMSTPTHL